MQPCMVVARSEGPCAYAACMSHLAFVFPGQGSQSVGMGRDPRRGVAGRRRGLRRRRRRPRRIDQRRWPGTGPADRLDLTENAQPAILAASIAILAALRERWAAEGLAAPTPAFIAGHSMGQYSALVAAGALDARRRHPPRPRARPADAGVRAGARRRDGGADRSRRCAAPRAGRRRPRAHGVFVVANRNAPGQVVVSGERPAIEAGAELAKALGAKRAIVLPVSVAAHSPLMAEAADGMREALAGDRLPRPGRPAAGQRRRAARSRPPRPAGPSSSST